MDCLFCKFANGEIEPIKIYEDEKFLAFLDINPMHPGHTLLIPKEHIDYIFDLSNEKFSEYFLTAKKVSKGLKQAMNCEKIGVAVEGFLVRHAHIHLVPLNEGDALNPCLQKPMEEEKLKEIAKKIRKEMKKHDF